MCERFSATRKLGGACLALSLVLVSSVQAGNAYLPVTGPTPLRIEVAMTRPVDFSSYGKVTESHAKTDVSSPAAEPAVDSKTPLNAMVSVTESNGSVPAVAVPGNSGEETPSESALPPILRPADNLLVITPQMLTEFFKPFPNGTNGGVSVYVPVQIGFTPPTEKNPPSSRATYKVQ